MKTENIYCDYCHKKTTIEGKRVADLNGFCAEIGYSVGGWGSRRSFIDKHNVEICDECFKEVEKISEALVDKIHQLQHNWAKS